MIKNKKIKLIVVFSVLFVSLSVFVLSVFAENIKSEDKKDSYSSKHIEEYSSTKEKKDDDGNVVSNIGSVSKIFVTTAVLQLCDKGLVKLDSPVTVYIPEFKMQDSRYRDITVRMLMNHSSGLMGSTWGNSMLYDDVDSEAHDTLLEQLKTQRLKAVPGEFSVYCNDGFFLLELLVERVSGKSYTQYIEENIVLPLKLHETGTPYNMFKHKKLMPVYLAGGERYAYEYCVDIGSGGIIASAPDLCTFGTAFFYGDKTLVSDSAKREMFKSAAKDEYETSYGLGWDQVEYSQYADNDLQVVGKGGNTGNMHSYLLVAPEEKICISVNASGGDMMSAAAMSESMLEEILKEEKGITVNLTAENSGSMDFVREQYRQYEGVYSDNSTLPFKVEFTDSYLKTIQCCTDVPKINYYKPLENGGFLKLSGDAFENTPDQSGEIWYFTKRNNGRIYIARKYNSIMKNLTAIPTADYYAERIEPVKISKDLCDAWKEYEGEYWLYSGKYSETFIESVHGRLVVADDIPGYVVLDSGISSSIFRIEDKNHLKAFVQIPCQNGRDLNDVTIEKKGDEIFFHGEDSAQTLICTSCMPVLNGKITSIETTKEKAVWYRLTEAVKGLSLTFERSEKTSIYVFDKYGTMNYSSYMLDYPNEVPLPSEGFICFRGNTGEHIDISLQ